MARWDSERIYFDGGPFFRDVMGDIRAAKTSIDVEVYIYEADATGTALAELLTEAARRGARVRLLVDGVGSAHSLDQLALLFNGSGVELRVYHPVFGRGLADLFRTLNRRNHRKTWIFDSRAVYAGSMNVTADRWKDFGLRVEGPPAALFEVAFHKAWTGRGRWAKPGDLLRGMKTARAFKGDWVLLNDTLLKRRRNYRRLLKRIRGARQKVWLANAYFVPRLGLARALCKAARGGADVRLMVPKEADVFFIPWLASTYYLGLLRAGVKIYEYSTGMFHAKSQIIDGAASLGSSNLNHRSLLHDLEADLPVTHPENIVLLEGEFGRDFAQSQPVTLETLDQIPWYRSVAAKLFSLFKYWL